MLLSDIIPDGQFSANYKDVTLLRLFTQSDVLQPISVTYNERVIGYVKDMGEYVYVLPGPFLYLHDDRFSWQSAKNIDEAIIYLKLKRGASRGDDPRGKSQAKDKADY